MVRGSRLDSFSLENEAECRGLRGDVTGVMCMRWLRGRVCLLACFLSLRVLGLGLAGLGFGFFVFRFSALRVVCGQGMSE